MNNKRWIAALVFSVCLVGFTTTTFGQTNVAIVDIGEIFKNHVEFTRGLEALKQEAEQFKNGSASIQQELLKKAEGLRMYQPGSDEYIRAESALAQETAKREVEQKARMTDMMIREAKLHYDTYVEVTKLISDYCQKQGIALVLRYNGMQMNPKDPATIMQKVNGNIVYQRPDKDITPIIIQQIAQLKGTANVQQNPNR